MSNIPIEIYPWGLTGLVQLNRLAKSREWLVFLRSF